MKKWPIIVAVVMLMSAWGSLQVLSHGEPVLTKKPFAEFPLTIGERWQGKELGLDQTILDVLKLSDYMMRGYVPGAQARGEGQGAMGEARGEGQGARGEARGEGQGARGEARGEGQGARGGRGEAVNGSRLTNNGATSPVWLYVGYYQSQRTGSTYHSPKNCLPGAGWQFVEADHAAVPVPGGTVITINKVLIEKGLDKQVILYWYQDRGRVIASEYAAKGYLIWDAMTKNRTDGALVRISVPVSSTVDQAYEQGLAFLQDLWPLLQDYMPEV